MFQSRWSDVLFVAGVSASLLVVACNKNASDTTSSPAVAEPGTPDKPVANEPAAPAPSNASGAGEPGSAGGLHWNAQSPLVARPPKSAMRAAEYGVDGDAATELIVSYFGADQGGTVEANMTRWLGQFTQPDGSETKAQRSERTVHGTKVSIVEVHGTYSGGMAMPGAPPKTAQEDAMLLGAIANGPSGPVFFKLIGARATVERARGAFDALIASLSSAS